MDKYNMSFSYKKSFNSAQNALPKAARRAAKINNIAKVDRGQVSTNSYRPYNQFVDPGTVSPAVGHPYTIDPKYVSGIGITAIVNP